LSHNPSNIFFWLSYVLDKVLCFLSDLASDCSPPTYVSCVTGIKGILYNAQFIDENWASLIFCPGWTWTAVLQISIPGEAGITDVSHNTQHVFINTVHSSIIHNS
jgi:hypothetical protein